MVFIGPETGILKCGFVPCTILVPLYAASAMIKMQVGQKNIGDIITMETDIFQGFVQRMVAPEIIITKEFFGLFVAQSVIDQNKPVTIFNQKTTGGKVNHIIAICRIGPVPNRFRDYTEHGASIQLKITGLYGINCHLENKMGCKIIKAQPNCRKIKDILAVF